MRRFPALVVAASLAVSLAACTSQPANPADCVPLFTSGDASSQVQATGSFGAEPTVSFPTPLVTDGDQVTELTAGTGAPMFAGQIVDFQVTALNAQTGEVITSSSYEKSNPVRRTIGEGADALGGLLQCAAVGSRLAATTTIRAVFGEQGIDPQYGIGVDDTIVVVLDLQRGFLGKANGTDQFPQPGFPAIALTPSGRPGITLPNQDAPTDLQIEVLKQGAGATVKEGDTVVLHYTGLLWDTKTVFDSSWDRGMPTSFPAVSLDDVASGGVVPGFATALIGQKVGSQVVVVIPPEFGYPEGSAPQSIPVGSTMVFVFDVLGIE